MKLFLVVDPRKQVSFQKYHTVACCLGSVERDIMGLGGHCGSVRKLFQKIIQEFFSLFS